MAINRHIIMKFKGGLRVSICQFKRVNVLYFFFLLSIRDLQSISNHNLFPAISLTQTLTDSQSRENLISNTSKWKTNSLSFAPFFSSANSL